MSEKRRFPVAALLLLVVGFAVVIALIAFFSFVPRTANTVNSIDEAEGLAEQYISQISSDLQIEEIMEFSNNFYVVVQEKSTGINALELLVDRYTGRVSPEPGPNMMWNTKYGHMSWQDNPTAEMPVSSEEAVESAQQWLDFNYPGSKVEEPDVFYGYYTMDVSKGNEIFGMLSVNGYSGDVWYHNWHGEFIGMKEYD